RGAAGRLQAPPLARARRPDRARAPGPGPPLPAPARAARRRRRVDRALPPVRGRRARPAWPSPRRRGAHGGPGMAPSTVRPETTRRLTRTFAAPRDTAFPVWTDPEELNRWSGSTWRGEAEPAG